MALELALILATLVTCALLLLVLFEPGLSYRVDPPVPAPDSREFLRLVGAITDSDVRDAAGVDVLTNGAKFYGAELDAIRAARKTVHIVAFIFHPSAIGDRFLAALTERAQGGVTRERDRRRDRKLSDARSLFRGRCEPPEARWRGISPFAGTR